MGLSLAEVRSAGVRRRWGWVDRHIRWLLVLPAVLLILLFSVYPLIYSVWVAFVNYDFQIPGHAFVGLLNFQQVLADPLFASSLVTTAILSAASVAVEFGLGLRLALAMTDRFRARGLLMTIFLIPLFVSPVIVGPVLVAAPAAAVRPRRLSAGPAAAAAGRDRLADPDPLELHRHHHGRRLAVDALHVRHPALGPERDRAAAL